MKKYTVRDDDYLQGTFPLRLELRIKNSMLVNAREHLGLTQREAAEKIGISPTSLSVFETMRKYPSPESQKKICDFYRDEGAFLLEEDVFPEELQALKVRPTKYIKETLIPKQKLLEISDISPDSLPSTEPGPEETYELKLLQETTRRAMGTLTPREERILRMRFGIGEREHTLGETGYEFDVEKERIRQIETNALRKLRHPTRSRKLKPFI